MAKAFAASFPDDNLYGHQKMTMNAISQTVDSPCFADVVSQVVAKVVGNPDQSPLVYSLYAGPSNPLPSLEYPPTALSPAFLRHPLTLELDVDTERIENICTYNSFDPLELGTPQSARLQPHPPVHRRPSALHLLPSLFNHSCLGTATSYNLKDVMVIRAARDLAAGEELTISYSNAYTYFSRKPCLDKYKISCDCILCKADRADGDAACRRREELISRFNADFQHQGLSIPDAQTCIRDVEATYARSRTPLRLASSLAHHEFALAIVQKAQMEKNPNILNKAIAAEIRALEGCGVSVRDKSIGPSGRRDSSLPIETNAATMVTNECCVYFCLMISGMFNSINDLPRADGWFSAASWCKSFQTARS